MKTKKLLIIILATTALLACEGPDGEPIAYGYFFQIRTNSEGKDVEFFSASPNYDYKSLVIKAESGYILFDSTNHFDSVRTKGVGLKPFFNETKAFILTPGFGISYLDYGNGNIDTLTQKVYFPKGGDPYEDIDSVYFHLNGKLVCKYVYVRDYPNFIGYRNSIPVNFDLNKFDPVIFKIHKTSEK